MKEREKRSISYKTKQNNGDDTCIHSVACSRHSYRAERGLLMVGSELNRMPRKRGEKNERREGSLSRFFFLVNFSTALYYLSAWNRLFIQWLGQYSGVRLSTQCMSMMRVRFSSCVMRLSLVLVAGSAS